MKLVVPGTANSGPGNCVCSDTITNTLYALTHMHKYFSKSEKFAEPCVSYHLSAVSIPLCRTSPENEPYRAFVWIHSWLRPALCMLVFFSAHTHTRASGSLRMLGCFFRQQPYGGNTQSVINHGRCLWEGSGTFLQHCTDKLHYHQLKKFHVNERRRLLRTYTLAYVLNISIMCCYLLYVRLLAHYGLNMFSSL